MLSHPMILNPNKILFFYIPVSLVKKLIMLFSHTWNDISDSYLTHWLIPQTFISNTTPKYTFLILTEKNKLKTESNCSHRTWVLNCKQVDKSFQSDKRDDGRVMRWRQSKLFSIEWFRYFWRGYVRYDVNDTKNWQIQHTHVEEMAMLKVWGPEV